MNSTQSAVENILIGLIKQQAMNFIISKIPLFANWFFNPIIGFFVGKVVTIIIQQTAFGIQLVLDHVKIVSQEKDFLTAVDNHNSNPTPENEQKLIDSFKNFVKIGV